MTEGIAGCLGHIQEGYLAQTRKGQRRFPEEMVPPCEKVCRILSDKGGQEGQSTHGVGSRHRGMEAGESTGTFKGFPSSSQRIAPRGHSQIGKENRRAIRLKNNGC